MSSWMVWVIQLATTTCIGVIAYFLKDMRKNTDEKIKSTDEKIKETKEDFINIRKDFDDFKDKVSEKYVMKEEFVRAITSVDKRFDTVNDKLDKIYITMVSHSNGNERK